MGRGISKPKKNTVASLLAQSRAHSVKSHHPSSAMEGCQINVDITSNTDTDSVCESGISESDSEKDNYNIEDLQVPLEIGWRRETNVKGISKTGHIKGEVTYYTPDGTRKVKNYQQLQELLEKMQMPLTKDNFSFSTKHVIGYYVQTMSDGEFIKMNDYEMIKVLEDINKKLNRNSNGEQRIESSKPQQIWRDSKKCNNEDLTVFKESAYLHDLNKQKEILYALELERERRNQLILFINQLATYKQSELSERKLHREIFDKLIIREKLLENQKNDSRTLIELRKPQEDLTIKNQKELPSLDNIKSLMLQDQEFADLLMVFQFINNFGDTLGFEIDMSQFTLDNLHIALTDSSDVDAEDELLSILIHLLSCAIEDPGIPNQNRYTTLLGQTLKQADITTQNVSEILRIYLYAVTFVEIKEQNIDRDFSELHLPDTTDDGIQNQEILNKHQRFQLSESLRENPFAALTANKKLKILTTLCEDLLQNKSVCHQIELNLELQATLKKERFLIDAKLRKYKNFLSRRVRNELEKNKSNIENTDIEMDDIDQNDKNISTQHVSLNETSMNMEKMEDDNSDLESESTLFEEEEDINLSIDDIKKKIDRMKEQASQIERNLDQALNSLRAISLGYDRYFRNYWLFPKSGVIFVESMATSKSEMIEVKQQIKKEEDIASIQIDDDEPDTKIQSVTKNETKSEDLFEDRKEESFDIEESIPTAILVQKENKSNDSRFVEINHVVPSNGVTTNEEDLSKTMKNETEKNDLSDSKKSSDKNNFNNSNWFSLLSCEDNGWDQNKIRYECKNVKLMTGLSWEIQNNLNYDNDANNLQATMNNHENSAVLDENQNNEKTFTLPPYLRKNVHEIEIFLQNDCLTPLQITQDEQAMLNEIKKNGFLKENYFNNIPEELQTGWWQISDREKFNELVKCLNVKGIREKNLRQSLLSITDNFEFGFQSAWIINNNEKSQITSADNSEEYNLTVIRRYEKTIMDKIELIEDKIASASMQVKGWIVPSRDETDEDINISIIRDRMLSLEGAIERRYLKPPLGSNTAEAQLAAMALEAQEHSSSSNVHSTDKDAVSKGIMYFDPIKSVFVKKSHKFSGLTTWREAVNKSSSIAQLYMAIDMLEQCIAWDKSIMKAVRYF